MRPILLLTCLVVLAACGVDENDVTQGPAGDSTATPPPSCSETWSSGRTLADDYDGCVTDDGTLTSDELQDCADGSVLVTHDERYWALLGGTVEEATTRGAEPVASDPAYVQASTTCTG